MGMDTHVVGIRPPDAKWEKMFEVARNCKELGIDPPVAVELYFDGAPDPTGQHVNLEAHDWSDDSSEGIEVFVDEVPADVKVIRFYNSW